MKKFTSINSCFVLCIIFCTILLASCTKSNVENENADPIVGKWFLTKINAVDVADTNCYQDSYIESDSETITFYLLDLLENGECETVVNSSTALTIQDDFYYLGDDVLEIYIKGNTLQWRIDLDNTMEFQK